MRAPTTCPDSAALKALLHGVLPPAEEGPLSAHLEGCARCQRALQEIVASGASWAGLSHCLGQTPPPAEAALQEALGRVAAPTRSAETLPQASADNELSLTFLDPPAEPGHLGRLGSYEILEVIGHGGMGVVFKAMDATLGRVVAVKVMAPQLAGMASSRKRFLREARAAAVVNHEGVVTIHAVGEAKGLPYLVMQYVEGVSLEQRLADGLLPLAEVVRIAAATARGLEAAHARGLIHRDVKPANILLESVSGRVKLTDFGLARAVDDSSLTQSGVVAGTPQYMAPEQARGEAVDHRADLFSLGSVMYALCSGRPPFEAGTPLAVLRRVSDERPPPLRAVNPSMPPWLEAIVARLHAPAPADRFQSAAELANLLERHLAQLQRPPAMPVAPPPRKPRSRRLLVLAALLLACLGAAGAVAALILSKRGAFPEAHDPHTRADEEHADAVPLDDNQKLAQQARQVLTTHCHRCHGEKGAVEGGFNYLLDRDRLVSRKKVRPGQPERSRLLRRIVEGEMPPEGEKPRPDKDDIALLERWIAAGAPDFGSSPTPRTFLSPAEVARNIRDDLDERNERDRRFTRYFTLGHLLNAGLSEDELQTYRNGLSKLLNSLSWKKDIVVPVSVDAARTVLRIDLRDYRWTEAEWEALTAVNPYENDSAALHLRGDWFVATASRPPLYHTLLQLPTAERELEKLLQIDVEADIHGDRVARAGFNDSGVSRNNRLIERHETPYGAYWKSYDFAANTGPQNLFERPLGPGTDERSFHHAGGEIIFNLPNGLQAYMLVNGKGERIDKGPTEIVSDPKRPDRAVENGLSCMACHSRGLNPKTDRVRAHVLANESSFSDKKERETILALYPTADVFAELLRKDTERYQKAAAATGAKVGATEPVMALAARFEAPLDLRRAAAEVGLRPVDFLANLEKSQEIGRAIGALRLPGGTVARQTFTSVFPEMMSQWGLETAGIVPLPKPGEIVEEPRPSASPVIPQPKLSGRRVEVQLPESFAHVRTGGGGRYLIFHLKKAKKLAIFDVSQVKIVHEIEVFDDVLFTAGRDKLLIVIPGQRVLQRWDLHTGKREKTAPIADERPILLAVMGNNSDGPLMLWSGGKAELWDVARMEPIIVKGLTFEADPRWGFDVRVAADGRTFVGWTTKLSGQHYAVMHLRDREAINLVSPDAHSFNGHWAMPSGDGRFVFRFGAGIYDGDDMKMLAADAFKGAFLLPTEDPRFFLAVRQEARDTNAVSICASADRVSLFALPGVEKMTGPILNSRWGFVEGEPRVHYLPSANVLVNLPESNDRVVLRPLNLMEELNRAGQDYLFVVSRPERSVAGGGTFIYRMDIRSKANVVRCALDSGPPGMTVSNSGLIRWTAPARPDRHPLRIIVTIRSASGKETQHAFDLTIQ